MMPALGVPDRLHAGQPLHECDVVAAQTATYSALLDSKGDPFTVQPRGGGRRIALVWHMLKQGYAWGSTPNVVHLPPVGVWLINTSHYIMHYISNYGLRSMTARITSLNTQWQLHSS